MQLPASLGSLAVVLLCQTGVALSYDSAPPTGALNPWKVTSLHITAPKQGRSGPVDVDVSIENPNKVAAGGGDFSFGPSAANCSIEQTDSAATYECTETTKDSHGLWTVDMAVVTLGTSQDFDLTFTLDYNVTRGGNVYYKLYQGLGHFEVGGNLDDGTCDDNTGACSYTLRPNSTPSSIPPVIEACQGNC
ncbi:hypothetical protein F5Y11DRAFT_320159 [Daldinia sp. FL1419]|nr:hypothetical protein F5Y11DRAFT_320159 [Daldinia sp. FL1419]